MLLVQPIRTFRAVLGTHRGSIRDCLKSEDREGELLLKSLEICVVNGDVLEVGPSGSMANALIPKASSVPIKFGVCVLAMCFAMCAEAKAETLNYIITHPFSERIVTNDLVGFNDLVPVFDTTLGTLTSFDVSLSLIGQTYLRAVNNTELTFQTGAYFGSGNNPQYVAGFVSIGCSTGLNRGCNTASRNTYYENNIFPMSTVNSQLDNDWSPGQELLIPHNINVAYSWGIPVPNSDPVADYVVWQEPSLWSVIYDVRYSQNSLLAYIDGRNGYNFVSDLICPDCDIQLSFELQYTPAPVPIPAALPLLASALGVFGFFGWRRKRIAAA